MYGGVGAMMAHRLLVILLSAWVLWHGIESRGQVTWRQRRTFVESAAPGLTAEAWCQTMRQQLAGHGRWQCPPEGVAPGEVRPTPRGHP
jgi:hypothetical protein